MGVVGAHPQTALRRTLTSAPTARKLRGLSRGPIDPMLSRVPIFAKRTQRLGLIMRGGGGTQISGKSARQGPCRRATLRRWANFSKQCRTLPRRWQERDPSGGGMLAWEVLLQTQIRPEPIVQQHHFPAAPTGR